MSTSSSRRRFLGAATTLIAGSAFGAGKLIQAPAILGSSYKGVQIGLITYSFRDMPGRDADTILQYILATGAHAVELMGDVAEEYAGKPRNPVDFRTFWPLMRKKRENQDMTADETKQLADAEAQLASYKKTVADWRGTASIRKFEEFGKMYKKAGVSIYAFKPDSFGMDNTDAEIDFSMRAARALGANQVTVEHPGNDAQTLKLGTMAKQHGIRMGYHGHEQQTPTFWDTAIQQSAGNAINLDLGHFVAAGNADPLGFIRDKHEHISSMHIKDRQTPAHGKGNLVWGSGDTPIAEALKLMRDNKYSFPATVELEYQIPANSDPVKEAKKCVDFCKAALG